MIAISDRFSPALSQAARVALSFPPPGSWSQPVLPDGINLAAGYPAPDLIPVQALQRAMVTLVAREGDRPWQYAGSPSVKALEDKLSRAMTRRGISWEGNGLLLTNGAIQGLDLAARSLLNPRTVALIQSPTYMEALEILRNYTAYREPVPITPRPFVEELERRLHAMVARGAKVGLLYLGASFQNPTGAVIPFAERPLLVALACRYNLYIIEDGAYDELAFGTIPLPVKAFDPPCPHGGHVIYLGTFSKTLAPGLRVGWAVAPQALIPAMAVFKKDLGNPMAVALVNEFLESEDYHAHLSRLRQAYQQRAQLLLDSVQRAMPASVAYTKPQGGYYVWMHHPPTLPPAVLLQRARMARVTYLPARHFYIDPERERPAMRLAFSYADGPAIQEGASRLGEIMRQLDREHKAH